MKLIDYVCSSCRFMFPSELGAGMYVQDESGAWLKCLHPGEFETVARHLGITGSELNEGFRAQEARDIGDARSGDPLDERMLEVVRRLDERLRFTKAVACLDCLHADEVATGPTAECPRCGSSQIFTGYQALKMRCPKCHSGTIVKEDSGIRF